MKKNKGKFRTQLRRNIMIAFLMTVIIWGSITGSLYHYVLENILLSVGVDPIALTQILRQFTIIGSGLTLGAMLLVLCMAYFFAKIITRPISRLIQGVENISKGNLDFKLDVTSNDEFGILTQEFNKMTQALKETTFSKDQLEELVEQRTQELTKVNKVLKCEIAIREEVEQKLLRISQAVEQSPASVIITDLDGKVEYINPKFKEITGFSIEDIMGKHPTILKPGYMSSAEYKKMWKLIKSGEKWQGEFQNQKKTGEFFWELGSITSIKDKCGAIKHFVIVCEDVTERKKYEEQLIHQASYDSLTGLPNRLLAFDRLTHALEQAKRMKSKIVVFHVDLDRFKIVNDIVGHESGDQLIVEASTRIKNLIRKADTVARLGGDEFLIILSDINSNMYAEEIAGKIINSFQKPFIFNEQEFFISVSIGIIIAPLDGEDVGTLLRNADSAMYRAKEAGGNQFKFFTSEMDQQVLNRLEIEAYLRHALEKEELFLHFQPLVDIESGKLVAAETLIRWNNTNLGLVMPLDFVSIAEKTGLIISIGEWILMEACKQAKKWQVKTGKNLCVAVNVSARQFTSTKIVDTVAKALQESGLEAKYLELEVTENLLMGDTEEILQIFNELSTMGVKLSLDDFGTGYSALSYLKKYPFNTLKIDRAFIKDIIIDEEDAALTKAIISMAHSLGLKVIGEGIETQEQLDFLRGENCDQFQGYYFSKPLSSEKFIECLDFYTN